MKKHHIAVILAGSALLLSACDTMDGFMSDAGYQRAPEPAVTRPVPRAGLSTPGQQADGTTARRGSVEDSPQTQPATKKPAQTTPTKGVVPNVAPSLGE